MAGTGARRRLSLHLNRADTNGNGQNPRPRPLLRRAVPGRRHPPLRHGREGGRSRGAARRGPHPTVTISRLLTDAVAEGPRRRPFHVLPPRLRPRRGLPEAVRRIRCRSRCLEVLLRALPPGGRSRVPGGGAPGGSGSEVAVGPGGTVTEAMTEVTRAEVVAVACADAAAR